MKQENNNNNCNAITLDTNGIYGTPRSTITLLESDSRFCKLAIQRAVWRLHNYKYDGYNPDDDH